jgi:hypothetical protein
MSENGLYAIYAPCWRRVDELVDGAGGSGDAVTRAAFTPYARSQLEHFGWLTRTVCPARAETVGTGTACNV